MLEVPAPQGEGRASAVRHGGEPAAGAGHAPRGPSPAATAREAGRRRPAARIGRGRAAAAADLRRRPGPAAPPPTHGCVPNAIARRSPRRSRRSASDCAGSTPRSSPRRAASARPVATTSGTRSSGSSRSGSEAEGSRPCSPSGSGASSVSGRRRSTRRSSPAWKPTRRGSRKSSRASRRPSRGSVPSWTSSGWTRRHSTGLATSSRSAGATASPRRRPAMPPSCGLAWRRRGRRSTRGGAERKRASDRLRLIDERIGRAEPEVERLRTEAADAVGRRPAARCSVATKPTLRSSVRRRRWRARRTPSIAPTASARRGQARAEALGDALDKARARAGAARLEGRRRGDRHAARRGRRRRRLAGRVRGRGRRGTRRRGRGRSHRRPACPRRAARRRGLRRGARARPGAGVPRQPLPRGGDPVRQHVRGTRAGVDTLLDVLVGSAVAVDGWETAVDLALANPGAVVVTRSGDRFAPTGWRLGRPGRRRHGGRTRGGRATTAAAAAEAARAAEAEVAVRREALDQARAAASEAVRVVEENERAGQSATSTADRVANECHELRRESSDLRPLLSTLDEQAERDRSEVAEVERLLPAAEAAESAAVDQAAAMAAARHELDAQAVRPRRSPPRRRGPRRRVRGAAPAPSPASGRGGRASVPQRRATSGGRGPPGRSRRQARRHPGPRRLRRRAADRRRDRAGHAARAPTAAVRGCPRGRPRRWRPCARSEPRPRSRWARCASGCSAPRSTRPR